ncbi:hypothetical protein [Tenacibaculum sp. C7A-26P2]|uniref:hypothetical protein n=1 Tax=Tenacibaculum sp. C7A-26P2 TaxID=3447504 RepID=UPI003F86A017
MKNFFLLILMLWSFMCFSQDQAYNYTNISLDGWLLVNNQGTSNGLDNGVVFGTSYVWDSGERIASNRKSGGYGPKNGLNFLTNSSIRMCIANNGNIGIGTNNPQKKLSVSGTILTKDIEISSDSSDWPDYVFESNYNLKPIEELETFISKNKHLPNFNSKRAIKKYGSYSIDDTTKNLLQTVEELSLYIIQLNNKIKKLENEVKNKN